MEEIIVVTVPHTVNYRVTVPHTVNSLATCVSGRIKSKTPQSMVMIHHRMRGLINESDP